MILITDGTKACGKGDMELRGSHLPEEGHAYQNVDVKCVWPLPLCGRKKWCGPLVDGNSEGIK